MSIKDRIDKEIDETKGFTGGDPDIEEAIINETVNRTMILGSYAAVYIANAKAYGLDDKDIRELLEETLESYNTGRSNYLKRLK